jgi:hypothetical protein
MLAGPVQSALQTPLQSLVSPSSQLSPHLTVPSPQLLAGPLHSALQLPVQSLVSPSSQASPQRQISSPPQRQIPSPQMLAGPVQSALQTPLQSLVSPSSQLSPHLTVPSPQLLAGPLHSALQLPVQSLVSPSSQASPPRKSVKPSPQNDSTQPPLAVMQIPRLPSGNLQRLPSMTGSSVHVPTPESPASQKPERPHPDDTSTKSAISATRL